MCLHTCVCVEESRKQTEVRDHHVWTLLEYFLTLSSIQVPLAFRDNETDYICHDAYNQHDITTILSTVLWPQCTFCTFNHPYRIYFHIHSCSSATLFMCASYTTNANVQRFYTVTDGKNWLWQDRLCFMECLWVMCKECCTNHCDITKLSIVFCCRGLCVLEYSCHTALENSFLFSSAGDPCRHDRALWLLLPVMWPSCLDWGVFTPGTGHAVCAYSFLCLCVHL